MPDWYKSKAQVEEETELKRKRQRLRELKRNLEDTDHKQFNDYEPKPDEDVEAIIEQRREWRREVRQLIGEGVESREEAEV